MGECIPSLVLKCRRARFCIRSISGRHQKCFIVSLASPARKTMKMAIKMSTGFLVRPDSVEMWLATVIKVQNLFWMGPNRRIDSVGWIKVAENPTINIQRLDQSVKCENFDREASSIVVVEPEWFEPLKWSLLYQYYLKHCCSKIMTQSRFKNNFEWLVV